MTPDDLLRLASHAMGFHADLTPADVRQPTRTHRLTGRLENGCILLQTPWASLHETRLTMGRMLKISHKLGFAVRRGVSRLTWVVVDPRGELPRELWTIEVHE